MCWLCLELALFCLYKAGFSRFQQETVLRREGVEGTDVFPYPPVCLVSSSHTGAVCGRFWGCCWMQDLFFEKAFTASSHEQEQLVLAGTAKVWLLRC